MCGIAGWLDKNIDLSDKKDIIAKMQDTLVPRGPDEGGLLIEKDFALIHRRLVVIDKENGKQPMTFKKGDEQFTIVYNGELYNTDDLRTILIDAGYTFKGRSDTEVVLKSYIHWGKHCAEKLNGIYAFAIYNSVSKELFMCRDKIGVKPFFYYKYNGGIIFASEIKAMLASGVVKPVIDETGLYEIMFLGPARTLGNGIFKGVEELLPGERAIYYNGEIHKEKYFKIRAYEHTDNEAQTIEKTRFLLTDSIERQLISDVPL